MTNPDSRRLVFPRTVGDAVNYFVQRTLNRPLTPRRLDKFYDAWGPRVGESNMPELQRRVRFLLALRGTPPPMCGDDEETTSEMMPVSRSNAYRFTAYRKGVK